MFAGSTVDTIAQIGDALANLYAKYRTVKQQSEQAKQLQEQASTTSLQAADYQRLLAEQRALEQQIALQEATQRKQYLQYAMYGGGALLALLLITRR